MKKKSKSISRMLKENLNNMIKSEMSFYEKNPDSYRYIPNPDDAKRYYCPRPDEDKYKPWKPENGEDIPGTDICNKPAGEFDNLTLDQLKDEEKKSIILDTVEGYKKAARIRDEIKKRNK